VTTIVLEPPAYRAAFARWRPVLGWWALSRSVTMVAFIVCYELGPRGRLGGSFFHGPLALFGAWDGIWYRRVAEHGYVLVPGQQSDPAFFPLYPILVSGLHAVGLSYIVAGLVIANVALAVAAVAFYELGTRVVGPELGRRGAIFLVIAPMSFVFSMAYPESLALALIVLALLAALADRWLLAAGLIAVAALVRPESVVFALPLASIAWSHRAQLDPAARGHALAACLAGPIGVATYPLYLGWALGDPGAWGAAESHWGRAFHVGGPVHALDHLPGTLAHYPWLARDLVLLGFYVLLLVVAARAGVGAAWIAAGALILILPVFSGSFISEGRFGLLALPAYWGLAALARTRRVERLLQAACLAALAGMVFVLPYFWP
jgi:hypothetical protein